MLFVTKGSLSTPTSVLDAALTTTAHERYSGVQRSTEKSNEHDKGDRVAVLRGEAEKAGTLPGEQKAHS